MFSKEMRAHTHKRLLAKILTMMLLPATDERGDGSGRDLSFLSSYFARKYDMSYEKYTKTFQSSELPNGKNIIRNIIVRSKCEK